MASISTPATGPTSSTGGHRAMAVIEAKRLARHPVFITGVLLAFGVFALMLFLDDAPDLGDVLSTPVIPAFFIGLTSLIATARLTRSTEESVEAVGTAPGTEARRTTALAIACLVPALAGLVFVLTLVAAAAVVGVHPNEWWFGTMPDWQVWSILLALGPVACLGGGLLGVLTGRWLRFPGAAAVVVVTTVAISMLGQFPVETANSQLRLWTPWASFHSGSNDDGTALLYAGNPLAYLGYALCLCAAAALVAIWHDRSARTPRLRTAIGAVVVAGFACLALAMLTGTSEDVSSEPIPYKVD